MRNFFLLATIFLAVATQAQYRNLDVLSYSFHIEIDDATDEIKALAIVHGVRLSDLDSITLDFHEKNEKKLGMTVEKVLLVDKELGFRHAQNQLHIAIPREKREFVIYIKYKGIPQDGLIISKNKYGNRTFFSDHWPNRASYYLPVNDHPSDKAKIQFHIIHPAHYQVIANGKLHSEERVEGEKTVTSWKTDYVLPTKVMVFGAADFAVDTLATAPYWISSWSYPENRKEAVYDYELAIKVMEVFEKMIGPYPFDKLANVQSTTRYGGMENASCIFYSEKSVTGTRSSEALIAHEIAHQWFGNSASESDWPHVWLSEGFATYFTHLYFEKVYGKEKMNERLMADRKKVIAYEDKYGHNPVVDPKVNSLEDMLSPISYEKAAWVLHMMRSVMGDEKFFAGIREYYATYAFGNASTADFMNIMEKHGGYNVKSYFDNWLKYGGYPILTVTKKEKGSNGVITIQAVQSTGWKTIPLTIRILQNGKVIKEETIRMDSKMEMTFPKQKGDYEVILDPNTTAFFLLKQD